MRAQSDAVFTGLVAQGGFGKFYHNRELTPPDSRIVQRPNRDTLYSTGVFDLDAGPVTITLPEPGARFLTMKVIDEDHYIHKSCMGLAVTLWPKRTSAHATAVAAIRILVDPNDANEIAQVSTLQDAIEVQQASGGAQIRAPEVGRSQP